MGFEFINGLVETTKTSIVNLAQAELSNETKKKLLDVKVTDWVTTSIDTLNVNIFIKFLLKKYLIPNLPTITQVIFDLLKDKIKGITKEG